MKLKIIWHFDLVVVIVRDTEKESNVAIPIAIPGAEACKAVC